MESTQEQIDSFYDDGTMGGLSERELLSKESFTSRLINSETILNIIKDYESDSKEVLITLVDNGDGLSNRYNNFYVGKKMAIDYIIKAIKNLEE